MPVRPCLGLHDRPCGTLSSNGSRCPPCQAELVRRRSAARGGSTAQGYDYRWQQTVAAAIRAQPYCSLCGWPGDSRNPLTGDHIGPKSLGGSNDPSNVRVLCRSCNSSRGNRAD